MAAGFDALDTVVVLGNQTTVEKLKKGEPKFGVDIDLIVGRESALAQTDSNWTESETAVGPWSLYICKQNNRLPHSAWQEAQA